MVRFQARAPARACFPKRKRASILDQQLADIWAGIERDGPWQDLPIDPERLWEDGLGDSSERFWSQEARRRTFMAFYSWAVPSKEAIAAISAFVGGRRLLEVCAGSGLWAMLISSGGTDVIATDGRLAQHTDYFPIETREAEDAVRAHQECEALLFCWPPFKDGLAFRALRAFEGDRVVYIADQRFTADRQFHDLLDQEWVLHDQLAIPAWPGFDDYAYLYSRK